MSQFLTVEVSDTTFQALRERAEAAGVPPARWLAEALERQFPPRTRSEGTGAEGQSRFRQLFGSVDLGRPTSADNESIDSDLAREYEATHEGT